MPTITYKKQNLASGGICCRSNGHSYHRSTGATSNPESSQKSSSQLNREIQLTRDEYGSQEVYHYDTIHNLYGRSRRRNGNHIKKD